MRTSRRRVGRVGVNLCWLVPGVVGGSEDLLVGWLSALADHPACSGPHPELALHVFGPAALAEAHPILRERFTFVAAPVQGRAKSLRVLTEASWLPAQQRRLGLDVIHHAGGVVPLVHTGRTVLTVHDIQPLDLPQYFSPLKRRFLAAMLPRSVRAAEVIVATSSFVVDRLVDRLGADRHRCLVVPPVLRARRSVDAEHRRRVRATYGLAPHYVLYPAVAYPHKNHQVLYEAMRRLGPDAGVQLVLTGGQGPLDATLAAFVADHRLDAVIRRLGRVPAADYEALVAAADALVFPSRYEGFGLGAFDALAMGAAVVASDIAPMAEVLGADAALVDPDDADAWAARLVSVCTSAAERAELASRSVARAGFFDARRSADGLLTAYRLPEPT